MAHNAGDPPFWSKHDVFLTIFTQAQTLLVETFAKVVLDRNKQHFSNVGDPGDIWECYTGMWDLFQSMIALRMVSKEHKKFVNSIITREWKTVGGPHPIRIVAQALRHTSYDVPLCHSPLTEGWRLRHVFVNTVFVPNADATDRELLDEMRNLYNGREQPLKILSTHAFCGKDATGCMEITGYNDNKRVNLLAAVYDLMNPTCRKCGTPFSKYIDAVKNVPNGGFDLRWHCGPCHGQEVVALEDAAQALGDPALLHTYRGKIGASHPLFASLDTMGNNSKLKCSTLSGYPRIDLIKNDVVDAVGGQGAYDKLVAAAKQGQQMAVDEVRRTAETMEGGSNATGELCVQALHKKAGWKCMEQRIKLWKEHGYVLGMGPMPGNNAKLETLATAMGSDAQGFCKRAVNDQLVKDAQADLEKAKVRSADASKAVTASRNALKKANALKRPKDLAERQAAAQAEFDRATEELDSAQADVALKQANLEEVVDTIKQANLQELLDTNEQAGGKRKRAE